MIVHSLSSHSYLPPSRGKGPFPHNRFLKPGLETNRNCRVPDVWIPPKSKIKNPHQKMTFEVGQIKEAVRFGTAVNSNSVWGHVRHFDARHPTASKWIGFGCIVAVAATVGFLVDRLVNLIAHLTKRKNEKIGLVVGTVIGLVLALTHSAWYFNFPKKLEMRYRCRDFHSDSKTQAGQARQNIEDRALPLLMSMYNNAKSPCGVQHEHLVINKADVFDAMNYIATYNIGKEKWQHYLIEFKEPPPSNLPYFQANESAPRVGFVKGNYYASKWTKPNEILQRDKNAVYSKNYERLNRHYTELLSIMPGHMAKDMSSASARTDVLKDWNKLTPGAEKSEDNVVNENIIAGNTLRKSICEDPHILSDIQEFIRNRAVIKNSTDEDKGIKQYEPASVSIHALEEHRPQLFLKLKSKIESSYKDSKWTHRSWIRVEQLILVGSILGGLRYPCIQTMMRNFIGPFIEGTESAFGPMPQAKSAGGSVGMFIPMVCIGSAITVLGLGVSANAPPKSHEAGHLSAQDLLAAPGGNLPPMKSPMISHTYPSEHRRHNPVLIQTQPGLTSSMNSIIA